MPEPAAAEPSTLTVISVAPDALERHPLNPRPPAAKDDRLEELVESIKNLGQKQPCVVVPHNDVAKGTRYRIVIGHRRAAACRLLGRDVLCIAEDLDDDAALAIMLSDNEVHVDVDPFLEAKAVGTLLAREGWTLQSVAEALGKGVRWVARRANLTNLSPDLRKILASLPNPWPLEWMEELAKLDVAGQAKLSARYLDTIADREELYSLLAEELHILGKAPWSLEDGALCPKAGACADCPKTSLRAPGLFDAGEDVENPKKKLRAATCRDSTCWGEKSAAFHTRQVEEARAAGKKVLHNTPHGAGREMPEFVKGLPKIAAYGENLKDAKKDHPDSVLVVETGYDGSVTSMRWVRDPGVKARAPASVEVRAHKRAAPGAAERLKASKERIAKRREAFIDLAFKDAIAAAELPQPSVVMAFAAAFEVPRPKEKGREWGLDDKAAQRLFQEAAENRTPPTTLIWPRVRETLTHCWAPWMADVLGIDLKALSKKAVEEIPDPKSWKSLEAEVKGKRKPYKGKAPAWTKEPGAVKAALKKRRRKKAPVADTLDGAPGEA